MNESQSEFYAYGDASEVNSAIIYALVMVSSEKKSEVELELATVKEGLGASSATRIHCKDLFHRSARAKTDWRHLDDDSVFSFCENLANTLVGKGVQFF